MKQHTAFVFGRAKRAVFALAFAAFLLPVLYAGAARETQAAPVQRAENAELWLKEYFNIDISAAMTQQAFCADLLLLQNQEAGVKEIKADAPDASLTALDAVKYACSGANLAEVALVYPAGMVSKILSGAGVTGAGDYGPYLACALEGGLLDAAGARSAANAKTADKLFLAKLLYAVAEHNGVGRTSLGMSDDPAIYGKLFNAWDSFVQFDDKTLSDLGVKLVTGKVTTGYNLESDLNNCRFLNALTIVYGHSDIVHAQQVIAMLNSEGIAARVAFEPKVSIYQYLLEWGEPGAPSRTYEVRKYSDDLYLAYATEYDLCLEFGSVEDLQKFDSIILNYAKKNTGEEGKRLLAGAWWQPLYYTRFDPGKGYKEIVDNVITDGSFSLHPFSLKEKAGDMQKWAAANGVTIRQDSIWVNDAFYRYLNGESE